MAILVTYQHFETVLIFLLVTYSPDRFNYLTVVHVHVLLSYMKTGGCMLPSFEKKLHVWQPLTKSRSLTKQYRLFLLFLDSDVSEKA